MSDARLLVYIERADGPQLVGQMFTHVGRAGRQSASFSYDNDWLQAPHRFAIDPTSLPLTSGAHHTAPDQVLFGGIADSAPDRWGRTLIARRARREDRGRTLFESDYLLGVDDTTRLGALRFKVEPDGPFLADHGTPVPPLVRLAELLDAADHIDDEDDDAALKLLFAPGSSLGGARPKASVTDIDGALAIAKFPSHHDDWPVVVWEQVALDLAHKAGIRVPKTRLEAVAGRKVLLARRFDRTGRATGQSRLPYLSAMALLGARDGDEHSYLEIADAIRQWGSNTPDDLIELWRRLVFNVLITNTDDHLRNHGFLWAGDGWALSPAFDLNPVPVDVKPRVHQLQLDDASHDASLDTVFEVAPLFGLKSSAAERVAGEVGRAVARWRTVGKRYGLRESELDRMASAFEHPDAQHAKRL